MKMQLTQRQIDSINAIIATKTRIALDQEALADDMAALAQSLGVKKAEASRLVTTVLREKNKGGVIEQQQMMLDLAMQAVDENYQPAAEEGQGDETGNVVHFHGATLSEGDKDPLYDEAVQAVSVAGRASISHVQRVLRIGYNRAARLIEEMEKAGIVTAMGADGTRQLAQ